jgi:hypothetical protein
MTNTYGGQICPSPPTPLIGPQYPPLKRVRLVLPPSPPPEVQAMEGHSPDPQQPQRTTVILQRGKRIVFPTDRAEEAEEHRLRSGSHWRQHDLALLKVKFDPDEDSELRMLEDAEHAWSPSQRQRISPSSLSFSLSFPVIAETSIGVEDLVRHLTSITLEMLKGPDFEDDIERNAPKFESFFERLSLLLSDNVGLDEMPLSMNETPLKVDAPVSSPARDSPNAPPSASKSRKRPISLTLASSIAKVRRTSSKDDDAPQTPDQIVIPKNPAFSGDSNESTEEDNTKRMIGTLIDDTLRALRDFTRLPWPRYAQNSRLRSAGYFASLHF